tara:strand:+ start:5346 stop:5747 length:402 start_codon:yes stop_codon:yes gene_type:complete
MARLILVRGLPGSGKSTFARFLGLYHIEADMFYLDDDDNYCFNPARIKDAHVWCQNGAKEAIAAGMDTVVSNTFTQNWEMRPYFQMGAESVTVVTCEGDFGSIHNVPSDVIAAMKERWEPLLEKENRYDHREI